LEYSRLMLVIAGLICLVFQVHSQGDNFVTVDPAISEMETSLDMPRPPVATESGSEVPMHSSGHAANVPIQNLTGGWHLELTNGKNIDLILSQSGSVVFGSGKVTSGNVYKGATANGFISGNVLGIDVVPVDGTELYSLALDLSSQTPARTYRIFSANAATLSGTVRSVSYTTGL
jgi:hypothetical protein